jgi:hypothetical protein
VVHAEDPLDAIGVEREGLHDHTRAQHLHVQPIKPAWHLLCERGDRGEGFGIDDLRDCRGSLASQRLSRRDVMFRPAKITRAPFAAKSRAVCTGEPRPWSAARPQPSRLAPSGRSSWQRYRCHGGCLRRRRPTVAGPVGACYPVAVHPTSWPRTFRHTPTRVAETRRPVRRR